LPPKLDEQQNPLYFYIIFIIIVISYLHYIKIILNMTVVLETNRRPVRVAALLDALLMSLSLS